MKRNEEKKSFLDNLRKGGVANAGRSLALAGMMSPLMMDVLRGDEENLQSQKQESLGSVEMALGERFNRSKSFSEGEFQRLDNLSRGNRKKALSEIFRIRRIALLPENPTDIDIEQAERDIHYFDARIDHMPIKPHINLTKEIADEKFNDLWKDPLKGLGISVLETWGEVDKRVKIPEFLAKGIDIGLSVNDALKADERYQKALRLIQRPNLDEGLKQDLIQLANRSFKDPKHASLYLKYISLGGASLWAEHKNRKLFGKELKTPKNAEEHLQKTQESIKNVNKLQEEIKKAIKELLKEQKKTKKDEKKIQEARKKVEEHKAKHRDLIEVGNETVNTLEQFAQLTGNKDLASITTVSRSVLKVYDSVEKFQNFEKYGLSQNAAGAVMSMNYFQMGMTLVSIFGPEQKDPNMEMMKEILSAIKDLHEELVDMRNEFRGRFDDQDIMLRTILSKLNKIQKDQDNSYRYQQEMLEDLNLIKKGQHKIVNNIAKIIRSSLDKELQEKLTTLMQGRGRGDENIDRLIISLVLEATKEDSAFSDPESIVDQKSIEEELYHLRVNPLASLDTVLNGAEEKTHYRRDGADRSFPNMLVWKKVLMNY